MHSSAYQYYCRVIFTYEHYPSGEFPPASEILPLSGDDKVVVKTFILNDIASNGKTLLTGPLFSSLQINGAWATKVSYTRSGDNGPVQCFIYYFHNQTDFVRLICSYRMKPDEDKLRMASAIDSVVESFKWLR